MARPARLAGSFAFAAALASLAGGASATWSIAAVDSTTRQVGVAGASCIGGAEILAGLAPGRGAIAAQALPSLRGRYRGEELLRQGASPREVLEKITAPAFDSPYFLPLYKLRQYGVAALGVEDASANYTGAWTWGWAGAAAGRGVSVQGNLLRGPEVVSEALAAFGAAVDRCPVTLADRLMAALEAGALAGGDRRCSVAQTALSAFVMVAGPSDAYEHPTLRLLAPEQEAGGENPVALLRQAYEKWRRQHPPDASGCPD